MPPAENSETPKYNLPPPTEGGNESIDQTPEQQASSPEIAQISSSPKSTNPVSITDFQVPDPVATQVAQTKAQIASSNSNPAIADDNDLIEKEWVSKAKKIIEATREDPYAQSKEITEFKADYMKKRYNKNIKVSE